MRMPTGLAALAAVAMMPMAPVPAIAQRAVPSNPALDAALSAKIRDGDRARDRYRHPRETLEFFGVEPGMSVVDYMPTGGWYSRILVPYLGKDGTYIGMNPDVSKETGYLADTYGKLADTFPGEAAKWAPADGARILAFNSDRPAAVPDGSVDRVLIFREVHNMFRFGWFYKDVMLMRKMLKPGGMIGVIDHRVAENAAFARTDGSKGYMRESDVIALFSAMGFDLVAKSEINANPKDPADYKIGVWELPPNYAGAATDPAKKAQMDAIGESDRMTLLFRKRP
ncbi:MAG: class I SAM-dependent methyltransferase [Novosphingobium sp.]|nr:class I SAM-dependent methyltransferase [Novosphingobium sp.]